MSPSLQILPPDKIDQKRWDECVITAKNGLIYSRYDYLQGICEHWHGLIINDYEVVMALPWRKKLGFRYLYEPAFTQQQGLIGYTANDILSEVFSFARYGDILFNFDNETYIRNLNTTTRANLIIDLSTGYELISSKYNRDLNQNLKKASQECFQVLKEDDIDLAIQLYLSSYQNRFAHITTADFNRFKKLCLLFQDRGMCFTRKIINGDKELLAIGVFLKDEKRIYNVMNTTTDIGRKPGANHFLLDAVIRELAGEKLLFDFEGSDLPGVKSFYEKFRPVNQPYFHFHFNKLPFPLRLLKR